MTDRQLDAEIAEKVFGLTDVEFVKSGHRSRQKDGSTFGMFVHDTLVHMGDSGQEVVPNYSTDIKCAWDVAEKLNAIGYEFEFESDVTGMRKEHSARFYNSGLRHETEWSDSHTAPRAICLAALRALGDG